jgi:hypothetical protein
MCKIVDYRKKVLQNYQKIKLPGKDVDAEEGSSSCQNSEELETKTQPR